MKRILALIIIALTFSLLIFGCKEKETEINENATKVKVKKIEKEEVKEEKLETEEIEEEKEPKKEMTPEEQESYDKLVALYSEHMESDEWLNTDDFERVDIPGGGFILFPFIGPMGHSISENGKYVAVIGGTDVVGFISIYDLNSQEKLINASYGGGSGWEGNILAYDAVLWKGDGYTLSQKTVFNDGKIEEGEEFLGRYHVMFFPSPFSDLFDLKSKKIDELVGLTQMAADAYGQKEIFNNASFFKDNEYSKEEVFELIELTKQNYLKLDPKDEKQKESLFKLFDIVYPSIHKTAELGLISDEDRVEFIEEYFEYMNFDRKHVPWLFE